VLRLEGAGYPSPFVCTLTKVLWIYHFLKGWAQRWAVGADFVFSVTLQLTTVAEQSRILQLEEELSLRRSEVDELRQCLRSSHQAETPEHSLGLQSEALRLRDQLLSANKEHQKESSQLKEKYEKTLKKYQQEMEKL